VRGEIGVEELHAMKEPALIIVDMLNDFLQSWVPKTRERLVRSTNALVTMMRSRQRPVIWVRQEFRPDLSDAFPETRKKGIRVTIEGVAADCVGSYDLDHHEISLQYMKGKIALVMSNEDIREMLDAPR
jgi:isochorismate hydrolase